MYATGSEIESRASDAGTARLRGDGEQRDKRSRSASQ